MEALMYWTGVVVWLAIAALFAWLFVVELMIVGLANSISYHRWSMTSPTSRFQLRKHWWQLVKSVARHAVEFAGYRNNGSQRRFDERGGEWRGIGHWSAISVEQEDTPDAAR